MHDDRNPVQITEDQTDAAVLAVLLDPDSQRPVSEEEVRREVGTEAHFALDALDRLEAAGLVHRVSGFAFATRPAVRAAQIAR